MIDLVKAGRLIAEALAANGFANQPDRQALALAEEVGEFVGAWRRWRGQARRTDTREHVIEELADVVITAYVLASEAEFDEFEDVVRTKLETIFSRGWREETVT